MWISSLVVTLEKSPRTPAQAPNLDHPKESQPPNGRQDKVEEQIPRLDSQGSSVGQAIRAMEAIPALTVGQPIGQRLPVVVEAERNDSRYWHDWIAQLPGVIHVEVAFVSFEEVES